MATRFETQPCGRCGGSGLYSFCSEWGSTCFKCGTQKGIPGSGVVLTKRGAAARERFRSLLPVKRADTLIPGDVVLAALYGWCPVISVTPTTSTSSWTINGVKSTSEGRGWLDVLVQGKAHEIRLSGTPPEKLFRLRATAEQHEAAMLAALLYQDALTKAGTPRKRAMKAEAK